ncbi:MAG: AbiH family protein [Paludibacteraceae bacterium]
MSCTRDARGVICHESYFNSLGDVENVVVRGHSLGLIDMPYFQEIKNFVRPDARWIFYYHSEEKDIPAIERGVKILGIDNGKWAKIKW